MVLGAIGVAMAMHAHLEQRMDMLAILKAMGAGSPDLLRIFLLQTLGLGLAGALLGIAGRCRGDGSSPRGLRKAVAGAYRDEFPLALSDGRDGHGPVDDAALLPAAAARCARSAPCAGAAAPRRAWPRGYRRLVCAPVVASPATGTRDCRGAVHWAASRGDSRNRR